MAHPNEAVIDRLYTCFRNLDAEGMATCYADDVSFDDPAFSLRGKREVAGMWAMLCRNACEKSLDEWRLDYSGVSADEASGSAHWEPVYRFSATGRLVHNIIDAEFSFRDGLIVRHVDRFSFWRWSRQALGLPGLLLGWTPLLPAKVRATAKRNLEHFLKSSGAG